MGWRRDSHAPGQRSRMLQGSRRQANKQSRHQHQQVLLKGQGLPLVGGQASQHDTQPIGNRLCYLLSDLVAS